MTVEFMQLFSCRQKRFKNKTPLEICLFDSGTTFKCIDKFISYLQCTWNCMFACLDAQLSSEYNQKYSLQSVMSKSTNSKDASPTVALSFRYKLYIQHCRSFLKLSSRRSTFVNSMNEQRCEAKGREIEKDTIYHSYNTRHFFTEANNLRSLCDEGEREPEKSEVNLSNAIQGIP